MNISIDDHCNEAVKLLRHFFFDKHEIEITGEQGLFTFMISILGQWRVIQHRLSWTSLQR